MNPMTLVSRCVFLGAFVLGTTVIPVVESFGHCGPLSLSSSSSSSSPSSLWRLRREQRLTFGKEQCQGGRGCSSSLHSHREKAMTSCRRVSIAGVSVSPTGFWTFVHVGHDNCDDDINKNNNENNNSNKSNNYYYWPLQITADPQDATSATSPEALTILQLIGGVDMAGAILPPDVLSKLVVLHAEENPDAKHSAQILDAVDLPEHVTEYSETNDWQRSKIRLPTVTLDELTLHPLEFHVTVKGIGSLSFVPSPEAMEQVCWTYDPRTSTAFVSLALALRYRAPMMLGEDRNINNNNNNNNKNNNNKSLKGTLISTSSITNAFPMYRALERLHQQSERVSHNIERGFEIHQLAGALRIAHERGDMVAMRKIQDKLNTLESMDQLPTQRDSAFDEME